MSNTSPKARKAQISYLQSLLLKTPDPIHDLRRGIGRPWVGVQMLDGVLHSDIDIPNNPNLDPQLPAICEEIRRVIVDATGSTRFQLSIGATKSRGAGLTFFLGQGFHLMLVRGSALANARAVYQLSDAVEKFTGRADRKPGDIMSLVRHWLDVPEDAVALEPWRLTCSAYPGSENFFPLCPG